MNNLINTGQNDLNTNLLISMDNKLSNLNTVFNRKFKFSLNSPSSVITLPFQLYNIAGIRCNKIVYNTVSGGNSSMEIAIRGFDENIAIGTDSRILRYTTSIGLAPIAGALMSYVGTENPDCVNKEKKNILNIQIDVYIDGLTASDIDNSNKLFLEIEFF